MGTDFLKHFSMIQELAETIINGSTMIKCRAKLWRHFGLYKQVFPRMLGAMESRIVYADIEAKQALIRETYWSPNKIRERLKHIYRSGKVSTISNPIVFRRCVSLDFEWLCGAIERWEKFVVPISFPPLADSETSIYDELHRMRLERSNFTVLEASWPKEIAGEFTVLELAWQQMWSELGNYLQTNETVEIEEEWLADFSPLYSPDLGDEDYL